MPRPRQHRKLKNQPLFKGFKPIGIPARKVNAIEMLYDEYEVVRLMDYENLSQEEAAKQINVSRPTLTRIYQSARRKIATALAEGLSIYFVESPHASFVKEYFCHDCQSFFEAESDETLEKCPVCFSKNILEIKPETNLDNFRHQRHHGRRGLYFGSGRGMGNNGFCVCSHCGEKYKHISGVPCMERKCEKCGSVLFRESVVRNQQNNQKKKNDTDNKKQS